MEMHFDPPTDLLNALASGVAVSPDVLNEGQVVEIVYTDGSRQRVTIGERVPTRDDHSFTVKITAA